MIEIAEGIGLFAVAAYGVWFAGAALFYVYADMSLFRAVKDKIPPASYAQMCHDAAVTWPRAIAMVAIMTGLEIVKLGLKKLP
jgi:hypothetical protein